MIWWGMGYRFGNLGEGSWGEGLLERRMVEWWSGGGVGLGWGRGHDREVIVANLCRDGIA